MAKDDVIDDAVDAVKDAADEAAEKAREGYTHTKAKLQEVGEDLGKRYDRFSSDVRRGAERAGKAVRQRYEETADAVKAGYRTVKKDVDGLTEDVSTYVRDNPGKSLLIAAGVGFLVGVLISRRRRSDD